MLTVAEKKREVRKLLSAKSPEEYIRRSLKSKLKSGEKASITIQWCDENGYTVKDIQYARNRNPYWKKIKSKGSTERNLMRFNEHNYKKKAGGKVWKDAELRKFIELQADNKDWQLAKRFRTTIPSVQGIRRKINLAKRILEDSGKRATKASIFKYIQMGEPSLRRLLDGK